MPLFATQMVIQLMENDLFWHFAKHKTSKTKKKSMKITYNSISMTVLTQAPSWACRCFTLALQGFLQGPE
jgi:hypothetical protein